MQILQNALADFQAEELIELELGIEGFASFDEFLSGVSGTLKRLGAKLSNRQFPAVEVLPKNPERLLKLLSNKKVSLMDLEKVLIYRTEGLTRPNLDFTELLASQAYPVYGIMKRLYTPMNKWFASAVSHEGFAENLWNDRDLTLMSMDKVKDEMALRFKGAISRDEDPDMATVGKMYSSEKQFAKTYELLTKAAEEGHGFHLNELEAAEKRLAAFIKELVNNENIEVSKGTKKKIVDVLQAIIEETEYLVAFNFLLVTTITAWNDSLVKLKVELEDK